MSDFWDYRGWSRNEENNDWQDIQGDNLEYRADALLNRAHQSGHESEDLDKTITYLSAAVDLNRQIERIPELFDLDDEFASEPAKLEVGTRVEANYRGRGKYYAGKISRVRLNGTFDVDYDDNEKEMGLARDLIRVPGRPASPGRSVDDRDRDRDRERDRDPPRALDADRLRPRLRACRASVVSTTFITVTPLTTV